MRFIKSIDIQSIKSVSLPVLMWASGLCTILGCSKLPVQYGSPQTSVLSNSPSVERLKRIFSSAIRDISRLCKKDLFLHGLCKNIGAYREGLKEFYKASPLILYTQLLADLIKDHRQSLSILDEFRYTPVHWAVRNFNVKEPCEAELFKLLLADGVGVNVKNSNGDTPLHLALFSLNSLELVGMLLAGGADVNAQDKYGATPLDLVQMFKSKMFNPKVVQLVQLLITYGAKSNNQDGQLKSQIWC